MDEINVDVIITDPVSETDVPEPLPAGTESVPDAVGADTDSGGSDTGDVSGEVEEETESVTLEDIIDEETGSVPVYIINETGGETLYNEEIGGVPVVITDDISALADYIGDGGTSYQMSSYYVDYFSGVLANMHDTDYAAFSARVYSGSSYVEHNYLVYDIAVDGNGAVAGTYPCIDIYRPGSSTSYTVSRTSFNLSSVPAFSYASFSPYSDLRKGVTHDETWAVLFAVGFAVVYSVCHDIFGYVMRLRRS